MDSNVSNLIEYIRDTKCYENITDLVINKFKARERKGFEKYGTTTDRTDLTILDWINHLQDELMDACVYSFKLNSIGYRQSTFFIDCMIIKIIELEQQKLKYEQTRNDKSVPKV